MRPPMPSLVFSRRSKIVLAVVAILVVLLILLLNLSNVYVNYLWFGSVGHHNVYSTMFWTRLILFFIFGVLMASILGGNMAVAYRIKPPFRPMSSEQQNLQNYVRMVEPRRRWVLALVMVISLLAAGASAQGNWQEWQLWLHGTSFHQTDPQFHRDVSFYAFDYPVYRTMLGFGFTAVIFALLLSIAIHYLTGAIRLQTPGPKVTLAARRHITALVFVFMALKAVAYWLDRYGFVLTGRSKFTGASYADVHAALPAKTILFWITIVLAVGVLASMWLRNAILPGIGFVVLLVLSILIGGIYPSIVQHLTVNPNASDKEAPYISRNIKATRQGYDIVTAKGKNGGTVTYKNYAALNNPNVSAVDTTAHPDDTTLNNIRILDPGVVGPTFTNLQKVLYPYGFASKLNIDRYQVGGVTHDYVVGARELVPGNLTGSLDNWINQYTVYTHGYGFVAAQAERDITTGKTSFDEGDIPPGGPLKLTQPEIYYGQGMNSYSIVGAQGRKREFNGGSNSANITYAGKGGVSLSSPLTKLAFALKYKETNFILNDAVGAKGAKIILNRDPKALVQKVAPFLTVDGAPYPFVNQQTGHMMWMVDGYTTMANLPYSERQSLSAVTGTSLRKDQRDTQINYIRNSVKATVDAYDGTVTLYDWDTHDPILKSWTKVFPGLVKPVKDMPTDVRQHVRYPQDLFNTQRALLAQYHINDPRNSYNGKGKWSVPPDPAPGAVGDQPSYYVLANPPGTTSQKAEFQLTSPMVVNNSPNLAAYISVDSDYGADYGKISVLQLPGKSAIPGPGQVANKFKSQATISKDITLLGTGQSRVIHGNLLTLPVGNSFLYVEPLYVSSSYPILSRVIVYYGAQDAIGYGQTLDQALADVVQNRDPGSSISNVGQSPTPTTTKPGSSSSPSSSTSPPATTSAPSSASKAPPATVAPGVPTTTPQVNAQLNQAYGQLQAAIKSGDQAKIGAANQRIDGLLAILGRLPTPSATPR
ncbi:UPF0182 family protein [uncultured Jatrophihabitans sp.]|uniref:UPF0182 family membrane protein n=1 Tax=uncultured Jatrophihabitans sp. TaxID=1610747 RepID=UPI0035CB9613